MLWTLFISFAAALGFGFAVITGRVPSGVGFFSVSFGVSAAMFVGCLVAVIVRKVVPTLSNQREDDEAGTDPPFRA